MAKFNRSKTYSPADHITLLGGIPIEGFSEDSMVTFSWNDDHHEIAYGADGEPTVNQKLIRGGAVELHLKATSDSNTYIAGLYAAQEVLFDAYKTLPFVTYNPRTGEKVASAETVIQPPSDSEFGATAGDRVWRLSLPVAYQTFSPII